MFFCPLCQMFMNTYISFKCEKMQNKIEIFFRVTNNYIAIIRINEYEIDITRLSEHYYITNMHRIEAKCHLKQ